MDIDSIKDPVSSEEVNVIPSPVTPPPASPKYKVGALLAVFALVAALPILMKSVRTRQTTNSKASDQAFTSKVLIHPGEIHSFPGGSPIYLSVLAYDAGGNPIFTGVTYEWGISSSGSLGQLKTDKQLAIFTPLNSTGSGDLWVKASGTFGVLWGNAQICQGVPCPTTSPTPTPTPPVQPGVSWETNYALLKTSSSYMEIGGQKYYGKPDPGTPASIGSDPPTTTNPYYTSLESSWTERGLNLKTIMQFNGNGETWWVTDLALYMNGNKIAGKSGRFFETGVGNPYFQKTFDVTDQGIHLYAEGLYLQSLISLRPTPTFSPTPTPTPSNLLKNSSLETDLDNNKIPDQWASKNLKAADGLTTTYFHQGAKSFRFSPLTSSTSPKKQLSQLVSKLGAADEALTLNLWSLAKDTTSLGKTAAVITVNYTDGTSDSTSAVLPKYSHNWLQRTIRIVTGKPYNSLKVAFTSSNQSTEYIVDDLKLTATKFASSQNLKTTPNELTSAELAEFK